MEHRGPDNSGIAYISKDEVYCQAVVSDLEKVSKNIPDDIYAILGHRRLSIIDLNAASSQPMMTDCGRYMIVYNGEIYNYKELRVELIKKGIEFRTDGDTKFFTVFACWGIECFNKFNGEWALILIRHLRN